MGYMSALMKGQVRGSTVKDRTEAAKWLAERKWGKTPDTVLHAHAHAIAEVPATLTNAVLTSIARGDKLKLEDIVDGAIVSEDASEEEIAGLLAAAEPDERDDGPGGSGPDSAGEAGPGDDTEEGDSDSVGEGGPELSAARDPGEDP